MHVTTADYAQINSCYGMLDPYNDQARARTHTHTPHHTTPQHGQDHIEENFFIIWPWLYLTSYYTIINYECANKKRPKSF